VRLRPYVYAHVIDSNTNIVRVEGECKQQNRATQKQKKKKKKIDRKKKKKKKSFVLYVMFSRPQDAYDQGS
jgi:hypothetical protein